MERERRERKVGVEEGKSWGREGQREGARELLRAMGKDDTLAKRSRSWLLDEMCKVRNIVLMLLVLQTTSIVLLMRYSRTMALPPDAGARQPADR